MLKPQRMTNPVTNPERLYEVRFTRGEAQAVRLAMIFGAPDQGHPLLDSARDKLLGVERRAANVENMLRQPKA